jgi:hypothetical protein
VKRQPIDLLAGLLADVEALDGALCGGSGKEFVDIDAHQADVLRRAYCWHCEVIGRCRAVGDALSPHAAASLYGGRFYEAHEPVDGWPDEVAS